VDSSHVAVWEEPGVGAKGPSHRSFPLTSDLLLPNPACTGYLSKVTGWKDVFVSQEFGRKEGGMELRRVAR